MNPKHHIDCGKYHWKHDSICTCQKIAEQDERMRQLRAYEAEEKENLAEEMKDKQARRAHPADPDVETSEVLSMRLPWGVNES